MKIKKVLSYGSFELIEIREAMQEAQEHLIRNGDKRDISTGFYTSQIYEL